MRLAVFGETNRTKHYLVKRALDADYAVDVLVSSGSESGRKRQRLNTVIGDIENVNSMNKVLKNADAVICLLHDVQNDFDVKTVGIIKGLISCMETNLVRRLVIFSYIKTETQQKVPENKGLLHTLLSTFVNPNDSPRNIADLLKETDIDWTIVGHPPIATSLVSDIEQPIFDIESHSKNLAKQIVSQITDVGYLKDTLVLST
jgi:putative NADH-flavin reductase